MHGPREGSLRDAAVAYGRPSDREGRQHKPPFPKQKQPMPSAKMKPFPDHGETSYKGAPLFAQNRAHSTQDVSDA